MNQLYNFENAMFVILYIQYLFWVSCYHSNCFFDLLLKYEKRKINFSRQIYWYKFILFLKKKKKLFYWTLKP